MRIDIATLFPDLLENYLNESIIGRSRAKNIFEAYCHNIRDYSEDKHRRVDDTPYSERQGMLMQAQPIYRCWQDVCNTTRSQPHVIYMSPQGKTLTQQRCKELSQLNSIFILCGHYEGVDNRIIEKIVDEEISIGDYVLTGGELPALVLVDSIVRMLEGTLSSEACYTDESHYNGLLEYPQYTRPETWEGMTVPSVLLSGHHANIKKWKHEQSLIITQKKRPDLIKNIKLSDEDLDILNKAK
ncbi:MAG: tRNA (guanosine(37)-N1)-methyltransferase TrmD [Oscillospiraceae bacterium]